MEGDSLDPLSSAYNLSVFFKLTTVSDYLTGLYNVRQEAMRSYYFDLSALQDSFRFRALHRARAIAAHIIDEKGEWNKENLDRVIEELKNNGYTFYPEGHNDGVLSEHALRFLTRLSRDSVLAKNIKRFQHPLCHSWAEKLVLETLGLYSTNQITTYHIRRAIVCACLTPLRQSVGSCFASAPAILIQREQVDMFLDDLYQLLTTGKLKRTYAGIEYGVPLSPNIGAGDLRKNLLLSDPKAMIWFSPGLIAACEILGIIDSGLSDAKKAEILRERIPEYVKERQKMTVEELIHVILLQEMGISEEQLQQAARMSRAQVKIVHLLSSAPPSKNMEVFEQFQRTEKLAQAAFMGVCDNALVKAWEYTLASFADVKMEFSRWNLYQSLGFSSDESGGIGELIFQHVDEKLQQINAKIEKFQQQMQAAFDAAKATETLLRQAGSESEARRLQAEYQSRAYHMQSCLTLRDQLYEEGSHYSTLFKFLLEKYDALFPEYFQEIYDPNRVDPTIQLHEDSPAGFRLVYKHGRADPSQWTLIYDAEGYIDCLVDFFTAVETRIAVDMEWEEGKKEFSSITTALLALVRSDAFLHSALQRVSQRSDRGKKTPWSYTSGGTVDTLLKTYFCREGDFTKEEKKVENENELFTFIVDALKGLTPLTTDPFLKDPAKGMLMTSPSHAFILLPGRRGFAEGWQENGFSYTWVRDQILLPSQQFYSSLSISQVQQIFLLDAFSSELPPLLSHDLHRAFHADPTALSIPAFRQKILEILIACTQSEHGVQKRALADGLDAFLFQTLPIVSGTDWKLYVKQLLSDLYDDACREVLYPLTNSPCAYMSAKKIKELAKMIYIQSRKSLHAPFDLHQYIADHARYIGLAPPTALIVADTNWANQYFGFLVNPGTSRLELWSLDQTASQGTPMSDWKHWFSAAHRIPWILYVHPAEYTMTSGTEFTRNFQKI